MKKLTVIGICLLIISLLFGCSAKEQNNMKPNKAKTATIEITFINEVTAADIWVLPATKENLSTTVWGAATAPKLEQNGKAALSIEKAAEGTAYMVRAIDTDSIYYSINDISLSEGCTLRLFSEGGMSISLEVTAADGTAQTYTGFSAAL